MSIRLRDALPPCFRHPLEQGSIAAGQIQDEINVVFPCVAKVEKRTWIRARNDVPNLTQDRLSCDLAIKGLEERTHYGRIAKRPADHDGASSQGKAPASRVRDYGVRQDTNDAVSRFAGENARRVSFCPLEHAMHLRPLEQCCARLARNEFAPFGLGKPVQYLQ